MGFGCGWQEVVCGLLVLLPTIAVYWRVITFGSVNLDDPEIFGAGAPAAAPIDPRRLIESLWHVGRLNLWHPVTWWSHQIDTLLAGEPGWAWRHAVNLALHGFSAVVLFLIMRMAGLGRVAAVLGALLFALHPQRVEAVAWLSARKDLLGAAFFLAALPAWMLFRRTGLRRWWLAACMLGVLAMASHPGSVVLVGVLLAFDAMSPEHRRTGWRAWLPRREHLPLCVAAIAVAALTYHLHRMGGHAHAEAQASLMDRGGRTLLGVWFYGSRTFWPWPCRLFEIPPDSLRERQLLAVGAAAFLAVAFLVADYARSWRHGAAFRAGLLWAAFALVPVAGIVGAGPYLGADRHAFLFHAGVAFALAAALESAGRLRHGALAACLLAALTFALLATRRLPAWSDSTSLFEAEVALSPRSKIAPLHLGAAHLDAGSPSLALAWFERALAIDPDFDLALQNAARARSILDAQPRGWLPFDLPPGRGHIAPDAPDDSP